MARKNKDQAERQTALNELKKYLPGNKALALSFAVTLVFASVGESTTTLAVDPKDKAKQNMVLEKEKEGREAERDWEQDEEQGYSYYNPGYGYYYRPFMYTGSSYSNSRRAAWGSSTGTKKSSVGGYSISKGGATG